MIFIANARGDIQGDLAPYAVNQGSDNANQIVFAAPMPENATVSVIFKLPNGVVTLPYILANIAQVQGIFDDKGVSYRCWSADIDYPITEIPGSVTAQFVIAYAATGGKPAVRHTTATVFTVNDGITYHPDPPADPSDWEVLLTQIETAISTANMNKDEAERAEAAADDAKKAAEDAKKAAEDAKVDAAAAAADAKKATCRINEVTEQLDEAKKAAEETIDAAQKTEEAAAQVVPFIEKFNLANGEGVASVVLKNVSVYKWPTDPNKAVGQNASAFGDGTVAEGNSSFTEGFKTKALGPQSHAEGFQTKATGKASHAEGYQTEATGEESHAEGYQTEATGEASHAEGIITTAEGSCSHSEGNNTKATGNFAHAEGYYTSATGEASHAEGAYTTANGAYSHAEGLQTEAMYCSHAEGSETKANTSYSHAEGKGTKTSREGQHVEGMYNSDSTTAYHIIGDGTLDTDRHNLWEVGKDTIGRYVKLGDKKVYESEFNEGGGGGSDLNLENGTGAGSIKPKGDNGNTVSGTNSAIIAGEANNVSGRASLATGHGQIIDAEDVYAGGQGNVANLGATGAFMHGTGLVTNTPFQALFGKNNAMSSSASFIVGGGKDGMPKNLFEVGTDARKNYLKLGSAMMTETDLYNLIAKKKFRKAIEYVAGFANGGKLMVALSDVMYPDITYNYRTGKIRIEIAVTNPSNLDVFSDAPSALNAAGLPWGYTGTQITLDPGRSVYFGVSPVLISTRGNAEAGEQMYATYEVSALYESNGGSTELQYTETTELFIRYSDEIYFE